VPIDTLKSWRTRDHWKRGVPIIKEVHSKQKRNAPKVAPKDEAFSKPFTFAQISYDSKWKSMMEKYLKKVNR